MRKFSKNSNKILELRRDYNQVRWSPGRSFGSNSGFGVAGSTAVLLALNAFALIMLRASMPISVQPSIGWPNRRTAKGRRGNGSGAGKGPTSPHSNMANTNYWFFCKCTRNEENSLIKMKWNDACESQFKLR